MPVNDKILVTDYNNIRNKIVNVLGVGNGTSGYGQVISSSAVSLSNRVTINEYALLRNDIINAFTHIYGSPPVLAEPVIGDTVRFNTDFTPSTTDSPVTQYDQYADQITANRFVVHPSQSITTTKGERSRNDWVDGYWNTKLSCTVTVTFSTSAAARHFFNSGGEIRFVSSRTGGTIDRQQNISWSSLLNSAGTIRFGVQLPTAEFSPMNGENFYRLTDVYQVWSSITSSSPYTANIYRISARSNVANNSTGTATRLEFLVEWDDGYSDPGPPSPGDEVDGTITLSISTLEASGFLVPIGAGLFSVESPSVLIGEIIQDASVDVNNPEPPPPPPPPPPEPEPFIVAITSAVNSDQFNTVFTRVGNRYWTDIVVTAISGSGDYRIRIVSLPAGWAPQIDADVSANIFRFLSFGQSANHRLIFDPNTFHPLGPASVVWEIVVEGVPTITYTATPTVVG